VSEVRHHLDPDPMRASKATAVLGLGVTALLTGALLGGVVPAILALMLARQSRRDLIAAEGFLLGARRLRTGVRLAWAGIVLALVTLTVGAIAGLLTIARQQGVDFAPTVN
jgi:(hydroxyamino)benzene mutase